MGTHVLAAGCPGEREAGSGNENTDRLDSRFSFGGNCQEVDESWTRYGRQAAWAPRVTDGKRRADRSSDVP